MAKIKYQLIEQQSAGKNMNAYTVLHPQRAAVAKIQVLYNRRGSTRVDVYDRDTLIHQYHIAHERLKYPFAKALEGITIMDVTINNTGLPPEEQGLGILKAKGFLIMKAI